MIRRARAVVVVCGFLVAAATGSIGVDTAVGARQGNVSAPTFTKDIAPIFFANCVTCHRTGEVAPMSLLTYADARPWARAIGEKVRTREMPPWFADPAYGKFRNEQRLTGAEIATIVAWVDAGAPKGSDADLPPAPHFGTGWKGGEPDSVIEMPLAFELPAEGMIPLQNFYVPVPYPEDRFAETLEMRPSNPGVLHHGGAYVVDLPPGARLVGGRAIGPQGRELTRDQIRGVGESVFETMGASKLVSFVPGRGFERHRPGVAKRIVAGKYVHFDLHYQPTGKPELDRSRLGLWFSKVPVTHEVLTRTVGGHFIINGREAPSEYYMVNGERRLTELIETIPPYAENWEMVGVQPFQEPATLYAMSPHMHLRGKDMTYVLTYPDGRDEVLLSVPKYDFNWQLHYELETPLRIPAGSKLVAITHWDNSLKNRYNPGPEKWVYWSEQSWDEMNLALIEVTFDSRDLRQSPNGTRQP